MVTTLLLIILPLTDNNNCIFLSSKVRVSMKGAYHKIVINNYTRWLSHDAAISSIKEAFPDLLGFFTMEAPRDVKGAGLSVLAGTVYFLRTLCLFNDVLPILTRFVFFKLISVNLVNLMRK